MKRIRVIWRLLIAAIMLCSFTSASDRSSRVNTAYFDGIKVSAKDKLLFVKPDHKKVKPNSDYAELFTFRKPQSDRLKNSCHLSPIPWDSFVLDCGAEIIWKEDSDWGSGYAFYLNASQGDWYQIVLDPRKRSMVWVKDPHIPGITFSVQSIMNWLGGSFVAAHDIGDPIQVFQSPNDSSKKIIDCSSWNDSEGLIGDYRPDDRQMLPSRPNSNMFSGDWVRVECMKNDCFAGWDEPGFGCDSNSDRTRAQNPKCLTGWARWRTQDGRLHLYPDEGPDGC